MARTLGWGSKGREFESRRSDNEIDRIKRILKKG